MALQVTGGKALPPEILDHILERTDGVPLFVEELTRTLLESGLLTDAGDHYKQLTPLLDYLNALVEPDARGDPMSPLRCTCKSLRPLAAELGKLSHKVSHTVVRELLKKQKFSLQANRKRRERADNPYRDAQFASSTTLSRQP